MTLGLEKLNLWQRLNSFQTNLNFLYFHIPVNYRTYDFYYFSVFKANKCPYVVIRHIPVTQF